MCFYLSMGFGINIMTVLEISLLSGGFQLLPGKSQTYLVFSSTGKNFEKTNENLRNTAWNAQEIRKNNQNNMFYKNLPEVSIY